MDNKICSKCNRELPLTDDYFNRRKDSKDGFRNICRECKGNTFGNKRKNEAVVYNDRTKKCNKCGRRLPLDSNHFRKSNKTKDGFQGTCKECKGLSFNDNTGTWNEYENNILINYYSNTEKEKLLELLPERTWIAITYQASKILKLKRNRSLNRLQNGKRKCKECDLILDENINNFSKDKDGFRATCKVCEKKIYEEKRRNNNVITNKLKQEKLMEGLKYCYKCATWKSLDNFYIDHDDINKIHHWCIECDRKYYFKINYGDKYLKYYDKNNKYIDILGNKYYSMPEVIISNWLIENNIKFNKQPKYKDYIENDTTKRRFDWIIFINNKEYLIEYFGIWYKNSKSKIVNNYIIKSKKKIKDIYKSDSFDKCILIFPNDIKNSKLDYIFNNL